MNPAWSRYAAQLKNTDVVAQAIPCDFDMLDRVVDALVTAESLGDVKDEEIRLLLDQAADEVRNRERGA